MVKAILARQNPSASEIKFDDGQTFQQKLDNGSLKGQDGAPGKDGSPGKDGTPGTNGVSPTVATSAVTGGTKVTITDAADAHDFTVLNGKDGAPGAAGTNGKDGAAGAKGDPGPNTVTTSTTTNINGILKGNGSTVLLATAGTDYPTVATVNSKLNLSGGTMTGNIAMGSHKITGLAAPTDTTDAVNKGYVDNSLANMLGYSDWGAETDIGNATWWSNLRSWVLTASTLELKTCLGRKKKVQLNTALLGVNSGSGVSMLCVGYNCDGSGNSLTFQTEGVFPTTTVFSSSDALWNSSNCTAQNHCTIFGNSCSASGALKSTVQQYCSTTPNSKRGHSHNASQTVKCFIPSECQMGWNNTSGQAMSQDEWSDDGQKIPYQWYTSNARRVKYKMNTDGSLTSSACAYWERSRYYSDSNHVCYVYSNGSTGVYNYNGGYAYLAPAIVIG